MDQETESINQRKTYTEADLDDDDDRVKRKRAREIQKYDSLNNLVVLGSDAESILNDDCLDTELSEQYQRTGNRLTGLLSLTGSRRSIYQSDCSINKKLMFKSELEQHRSIVNRAIKDGTRDFEAKYKINSRKSIWRSFISLCVGLMLAFISFMPLRNIQTSLHPLKHIGNFSLAAMYLSFSIGCLFSNWITQNARPKGIILTALFGHVLFCAANVYPSLHTLIPASCFFGFFHAPLWTTQELMIASYGASYTAVTEITIDKAVHQFQTVFLMFCHAAQVLGNLLESAILHCGDTGPETVNMTLYMRELENDIYQNGLKIRNITDNVYTSKQLIWKRPFGYTDSHGFNLTSGDKVNYENIVKFVFLAFAAMSMTVICLFLNKPDIIVHKKKTTLCEKLREVRRFLTSGTFFSLFLLMLFNGMQQAVVIGCVTKVTTGVVHVIYVA